MSVIIFSQKVKTLLIICAVLVFTSNSCDGQFLSQPTATPAPPPIAPTPIGDIRIIVTGDSQPDGQLKDAVVRLVSASGYPPEMIDDGTYRLVNCPAGDKVTAWAPGYYISFQVCRENVQEYHFHLRQHSPIVEDAYSWLSSNECKQCHNNTINPFTNRIHNESFEWERDGHSTSLRETIFRDLYSYGFRMDYQSDFGTCGYCHAPSAITGPKQKVDLSTLFYGQQGITNEGINCDVCHKIADVRLATDGMPYQDHPGILSYEFLQPDLQNTRLYMGPYTNANLSEFDPTISCAPIYSESRFCAPCHYAKFWDTEIYASYKEWNESAYAVSGSGKYKTCQDCHMRPGGRDALPKTTDPDTDMCNGQIDGSWASTHNMLGRENSNVPTMVVGAASVKVQAGYDRKEGRIKVNVTVTNDKVGHKFPTDSPLRHLILVVEAVDGQGKILPQVYGPSEDNDEGKRDTVSRQNGETIPNWIGSGPNPEENYAGFPGKIFANILVDETSGVYPSFSYWNPTQHAWEGSDTRLLPLRYNKDKGEVVPRPDRSVYYFATSSIGNEEVTARLWYRYVFKDLAMKYNWITNDILVAEDTAQVK